MSVPQADYEIRTMESLAELLQCLVDAEQPKLKLEPPKTGHNWRVQITWTAAGNQI
jgi:hypothetical protein